MPRLPTGLSPVEEVQMRRIYICFLGFTIFVVSSGPSSPAQEKPPEKPREIVIVPVVPSSGFRAEFLEEVAYYEQRYTRLADAMPAEKYSWRPAEGVRSVGEVFTHVAVANYSVARTLGTTPPTEFDSKAITALSGDKAKVLQTLKDSFAHFRQAILALKDNEADKAQNIFNRHTTLRGSFIAITGHFGEHLGQSIAYARMNGVVPPWTEGFQQPQEKPADKPKP